MLKVVCNASPIIGLAIIGKLNLLWLMFDVNIPKEVYNEIVINSKEKFIGAMELKKAVEDEKIKVFTVIDNDFVNKAYGILHRGEIEVVVGALEKNIKVVIIDEKAARNFAKTLNLKTLGIIGVLKIAKEKELIKNVKPYLDELIHNKYRISEKLYNKTLESLGEL